MNVFEKMSAADRMALANKILELPEHAQRDLVERLGGAIDKIAAAEAESTRKRSVIAKLSAARSDQHLGSRNSLGMIDGSLHRAGVESLETLAVKTPVEINKILASATKLKSEDKFAVKSFLYRIGAIAA
jgi:hypothetical protein